jgi:hypothetical protein
MKWFAFALALACAHHEPTLPPPSTDEARESKEELDKQHEYFEEYMTAARQDCSKRCSLGKSVCQKARRICSIAEANAKQEDELSPYCAIAQDRCDKVDKRLSVDYVCRNRCWSAGVLSD